MPTDEIILNCFSLLVAGIETSRLAMNGSMLAFAEFPEQWSRVQHRTVGMELAVEEIIRWTTPALHVARTTMADTELAGQQLNTGDVVSVWLSSANRDDAAIQRPNDFDVGRTPNHHLAFSHGPHLCVGEQLARLEIGAVIRAVADRVAEISVAGEPRAIYSNFLQGFCEVPLTFTPSFSLPS